MSWATDGNRAAEQPGDVRPRPQWSLEGKALSGPLAGARLEMIPEAYVSFWFAFSTFFENPELWIP